MKRWTFYLLIVFVLCFPFLEGLANTIEIPLGTKLLGLLLTLVWLIETLGRRRVRVSFGLILFFAYLALNISSVFWAMDINLSLKRVFGYFQVIIFYWIICDVVSSELEAKILIQAFVIGVVLVVIDAFVNVSSHTMYNEIWRFSASGTDPNNFGVMVALAVPLAFALGQATVGPRRYFNLVFIPFAVAAIGVSGSRTALFALIPSLFWILFYAIGSARLSRIFIIALLGVGTVFLVRTLVPTHLFERLGTLSLNETHGFNNRFLIWTVGLEAAAQHPLTGVGAGNFIVTSAPFLGSGQGMAAHNIFIGSLVELGIPGLLLLIGLWSWHVLILARTRCGNFSIKRAILLGLLSGLIGSMGLNWEVRKPIYLFWSLATTYAYVGSKAPGEEETGYSLNNISA